jgi:ABC-type transporter MlaC component
VSQLALTRAQFISVIKKKGFDGLMSSLQEKIALLRNKDVSEK